MDGPNVVGFTEPPPGSSTTSVPVPVTLSNTCVEGWSQWMNIDSPTATRRTETQGTGDYEMLSELREYYRYCINTVNLLNFVVFF